MRRVATFGVSIALVFGAACSSFSEASDTAGDGGAPGADAQAGFDATGMPDAPADALPSACKTLLDDNFATRRPEWVTTGEHQAFESNQLVLTPGSASKNGAVWWTAPLTYEGHLRVRVDFRTSTPPGPTGVAGDGLAISWIDANDTLPKTIGGQGESFELCGLVPAVHGYAVTASTQFARVAIIDTVMCDSATPGDRPMANLEGIHSFAFDVRPSAITGSLDGTVAISRTGLAPPAAKSGYFGLSAASSSDATTAHVITHVVLESCLD